MSDQSKIEKIVNIKKLTAEKLTPPQIESCKRELEELASNKENGDTIDLTAWIGKQFSVARNNIKLHGQLIRESGFFKLFPSFENEDQFDTKGDLMLGTMFMSNHVGRSYPTILTYESADASALVSVQVLLKVDFPLLISEAARLHGEANQQITEGGSIKERLSDMDISNTLLRSFMEGKK